MCNPTFLISLSTLITFLAFSPLFSTSQATFGDPVQDLIFLINQHRTTVVHAPSLTFNTLLTLAAQKHSMWLVSRGELSHTGEGRSSVVQRVRAEDYALEGGKVAEVLYRGSNESTDVARAWIESEAQRKVLDEESWKEIGVGRFALDQVYYWTVILA